MTKSIPRVAVLMAAYNGMAFIEAQCQSIGKQTGVDVSVFISVDASTDGTYEWCCEYERQYEQVTVLSYGDKFGGAAPNFFRLIRGVDFSGFDYVALADQDDIWLESKLIKACQQLKNNQFDGYSSNVLAFWDDGKELLFLEQKTIDGLLIRVSRCVIESMIVIRLVSIKDAGYI